MSRRTIAIAIDGAGDDLMHVVIEEIADQIRHGMGEGILPGDVRWSMRDIPAPVDLDPRQRRAAAMLLLAVGERPTLTALAASVGEADLICPGMTAADLPDMTARGRTEALRAARSLIDEMLDEAERQ